MVVNLAHNFDLEAIVDLQLMSPSEDLSVCSSHKTENNETKKEKKEERQAFAQA
jgi:hypothetical protein